MLRQLPAQQLAMVSDSCYSGSLVSGERIRGVATTPDTPSVFWIVSAVIAVAAYPPNAVTVLMSACRPAPPEGSEAEKTITIGGTRSGDS